METNELKDIWTALAENNIIDKKLAQENISKIINKKGVGLIAKMKKKVMFDYVLYLSAFILIPMAIIFVNVILKRPSPTLQIIGVFAIEFYLLFMFLKSIRKMNSLKQSDYTGTIKDSLMTFRTRFLKIANMEKIVMIVFSYFIITIALVQYFIYKGNIFPLTLSDKNMFFPIFLIIMLFLLPFVLKLEYKIRFSKIIKDFNQTIDELNSEL